MKRFVMVSILTISLLLSSPIMSATQTDKTNEPETKTQPTYCEKHKAVCTITGAIILIGAVMALGNASQPDPQHNPSR